LFQTGPEATFSRLYPSGGGHYLEPGARAARGFCVAWVLAVPALFQTGPEAPSHTCTLSRVETLPSQGLVSLEGSAYLARNRAIKCSTVDAVISRRGRAFLGVAAARAGSGRRGQADVTAATVPAILRRDDGLFAVAWPPRSWWGPPISEKEDPLQLMRAGRPPRRARPRLINLRGGENGGFLP
jgi:hypothetical protein